MCNTNGVRNCRELLEIIQYKDRFLELKDCALKMHSMFAHTGVCESTFFTMKQVKSKNRNRVVDETLDYSVRETSTTDIALIKICNNFLFAIV